MNVSNGIRFEMSKLLRNQNDDDRKVMEEFIVHRIRPLVSPRIKDFSKLLKELRPTLNASRSKGWFEVGIKFDWGAVDGWANKKLGLNKYVFRNLMDSCIQCTYEGHIASIGMIYAKSCVWCGDELMLWNEYYERLVAESESAIRCAAVGNQTLLERQLRDEVSHLLQEQKELEPPDVRFDFILHREFEHEKRMSEQC